MSRGRAQQLARPGADRWRRRAAQRRPRHPGRPRRAGREAGRHRQGPGPRRRAANGSTWTAAPPFQLPPRDPVLYYLQRVRDEAHRFAITTHRAGRSKTLVTSELDDIDGVGAARKRALLNHFGSARGVKSAGLNDLEAVPGDQPGDGAAGLRIFPSGGGDGGVRQSHVSRLPFGSSQQSSEAAGPRKGRRRSGGRSRVTSR